MNGHVFQCYGEATKRNQFARTTDKLDSYVGLHFKHYPMDIKKMIKEMNDVNISPPKDHEESAGKTEVKIWEKEIAEIEMYFTRPEKYNCALYSVIWNQCSQAMQTKLKSNELFPEIDANSNSLSLLLEIRGIA